MTVRCLLCTVVFTMTTSCTGEPGGADSVGVSDSAPMSTAAQPGLDETTRQELIAAREAVWRAFFEGDTARLMELLPEPMFAMEGGRARILTDARGFAASGAKFVGVSFTDDQFFVRDNVAQLQSRYRVLLSNAGKADSMTGFAIELFEKRDGRWVNPSWHLDATNR